MQHKLFSELIIKLKIKPDSFISNKIDELNFPFQHIKFIKKNINVLMYKYFEELIEKYCYITENNTDLTNEFGTNIKLNLFGREVEIEQNKKDCIFNNYFNPSKLELDTIDDNFIDEINRQYLIAALLFGFSLSETIEFIDANNHKFNIQSKKIYDEILSFWINYFKSDYCYFETIYITDKIKIQTNLIEFGIFNFIFNYNKNLFFDYSKYNLNQKNIIESIHNDKNNFVWYVIFGKLFWDKISKKIYNPEESKNDVINKIKNFDYNFLCTFIDNSINQ